MKPELLLLIGLPASGKTRLAKEWASEDPDARVRVNYDDLRREMFGNDWVWNRAEETQMKDKAHGIARDALKAGLSVVIDNTNLSRAVRASWKGFGMELGAEVIEQDVTAHIDVCVTRDRARGPGHRVGQAVIDRMAMTFGLLDFTTCVCSDVLPRRQGDMNLVNRGGEGWHRPYCPVGKRLAIVDIDGTVADCTHRLGAIKPTKLLHKFDCTNAISDGAPCPQCGAKLRKDWKVFFSEVSEDLPIQPMINLLGRLKEHMIIMVSGRPIENGRTKVGIETEDWLWKHGVWFDRLFLRLGGDNRPDYVYKQEVLDHLPKGQIDYVFEDRDQCVRMYREELPGALTMQVRDGAY